MKYGFMVSKHTCKNSTDCGIMSKALGEIINLAFNTNPNVSTHIDAITIARKALLDSGHSIAKLKIEDIK